MVAAAAWLTRRRRLMAEPIWPVARVPVARRPGGCAPALGPIRLSTLIERRGIRLRLRSLRVLKDGQGGPPSRCQARSAAVSSRLGTDSVADRADAVTSRSPCGCGRKWSRRTRITIFRTRGVSACSILPAQD